MSCNKIPYIIAVDFDGTLCEDRFPLIGDPHTYLIQYILNKQKEGCKIILWTCRKGKILDEAVQWCIEQGLFFDSVNKNLPEVIKIFKGDTRKVFADEYIDDKNVLINGRAKSIVSY